MIEQGEIVVVSGDHERLPATAGVRGAGFQNRGDFTSGELLTQHLEMACGCSVLMGGLVEVQSADLVGCVLLDPVGRARLLIVDQYFQDPVGADHRALCTDGEVELVIGTGGDRVGGDGWWGQYVLRRIVVGNQCIDFISKFIVAGAGVLEVFHSGIARSVDRFTEDLFGMLMQIVDRIAPMQLPCGRAGMIFPGWGMHVNTKAVVFGRKGISASISLTGRGRKGLGRPAMSRSMRLRNR